jgi:hypothetical protein
MTNLRRGTLTPLVSPEEAAGAVMTDEDRQFLHFAPGIQFVGTAAEVTASLARIVDSLGADEIILGGATFEPATRVRSLELIAKAWGLTPRTALSRLLVGSRRSTANALVSPR